MQRFNFVLNFPDRMVKLGECFKLIFFYYCFVVEAPAVVFVQVFCAAGLIFCLSSTCSPIVLSGVDFFVLLSTILS